MFTVGPDFLSDGGNLTFNVGEQLLINCSVSLSGSNPPNVTSFTVAGTNLTKENLSLNESDDLVFEVVSNVTEDFNRRNYTCQAGNGRTEQKITYTVLVTSRNGGTIIAYMH